MLDREGFRPNVGIILLNARNEVFWGKRLREHSWQFPQGASSTERPRASACIGSYTKKPGCFLSTSR